MNTDKGWVLYEEVGIVVVNELRDVPVDLRGVRLDLASDEWMNLTLRIGVKFGYDMTVDDDDMLISAHQMDDDPPRRCYE